MTATREIFSITELENAVDSLEAACSFLDRKDKLKWKWVTLAIHHSLYSMCISCLHGGQQSCVLEPRKGKADEGHLFQQGNGPWMKSKRILINDGPAYRIAWEETADVILEMDYSAEDVLEQHIHDQNLKLIGFWTAIARVQDPHLWMGRLTISKSLVLSDDDIRDLSWLHNEVRNNLMHFKPMTFITFIDSLTKAALTAVNAIEFLALKSYTLCWPSEGELRNRTKAAIECIRNKLSKTPHDKPILHET